MVVLFLFFTISLGWICFGYYIYLWRAGRRQRKECGDIYSGAPFLSVIVPCYNEAGDIVAKIENLRRQDYPRDKLEVIFVDGGSVDGTVDLIKARISGSPYMRLLHFPRKGKINQLNFALAHAAGEIIVNTDVDGIMEPDCLPAIVREFNQDPEVAVVSAFSTPRNVSAVDSYYWRWQNRGRLLETRGHTSSIAIAVCYAFKRDLLQHFPEDVVADDVYLAYLANTLGYRTVYSPAALAHETRGGRRTAEFLPHKFRKSNAFLRESLRFTARLPEMSGVWRMMFLTKLGQLLFLPWITLTWLLSGLYLLSLGKINVVVAGTELLLVLLLITGRIFRSVLVPDNHVRYSLFIIMKTFLLSKLVLFTTGLSYPFYHQDSSYKKLKTVPDKVVDRKEEKVLV